MRIVGIDPSSSCCGLAILEDQQIIVTDAWFYPKIGSDSARLVDYFVWLQAWLSANPADVAVVEFLSVVRNAEATRKVAHYQAISSLVCKLKGLMVIEARVTEARKQALGRGNLSKKEAYAMIKKLYPSHEFRRADKGGYDETDAVVLARGGIALAEK